MKTVVGRSDHENGPGGSAAEPVAQCLRKDLYVAAALGEDSGPNPSAAGWIIFPGLSDEVCASTEACSKLGNAERCRCRDQPRIGADRQM
jgi:hypothetical protein